jgi:hypothetical protein
MRMLFRVKFLILFLIVGTQPVLAQYPFERFPMAPLQVTDAWIRYDKGGGKYHWTLTFPDFYGDSASMTVQITTLPNSDSSLFRVYRGKKQIQLMTEPHPLGSVFGILQDSTDYGDINGDSLPDVRIRAWCGGSGIAAYYFRLIYLIQRSDGTFSKVSFVNMEHEVRYPERDLNGDGNFEIVATSLDNYQGHNYWTFNVYRFDNGRLRCVNDEFGYPIMVQYLYRRNYEVTNRISKEKMKDFGKKLPDEFSANY